jgi:hypothetical protein
LIGENENPLPFFQKKIICLNKFLKIFLLFLEEPERREGEVVQLSILIPGTLGNASMDVPGILFFLSFKSGTDFGR